MLETVFLLPLIVFYIWGMVKMLIANHAVILSESRYPEKTESLPELLPSQAETLQRMIAQIRHAPSPLALGLEAQWGMGKSLVISHLFEQLNRD